VTWTAELVSIVTPAYKAARFVGDAIRSVIEQDYPRWEMLIVDDCSPDDTCERVEEWTRRDARVRLIRQAKNGGPSAARNAGLANSSGRYVTFLDSDDYWTAGKLSRQLQFMRTTGAALSFTEFRRISEDGSRLGRRVSVPSRLKYSQLLGNTAIATSTVMIDRELTGVFSMRKAYYDDFVLWLELLKKGNVALGLKEDLMRYRVVGKSVSRSKGMSAKQVWLTYRDIEGLNLLHAAWCFLNYGVRGWLKYSRF
jgi:teichuronic acid biosynthesis glycosyltransferase TuaG